MNKIFILKTTAVLCAVVMSQVAGAAGDVQKMSYDVVVVGAGGTGVAAAAAAHEHGAKVVLLEKLPFIGGSSSFSGGAIAGGDTNAQKRAGMMDTTSEGYANIWIEDQKRSFPGGDPSMPDEKRVRAIVNEFGVTINWMEDVIGHKFAKPRPFGYGGPNYAHGAAESPVPTNGRGSYPGGGQYVIKSFKAYLDRANVPVLTSTPVDDLILNSKNEVVGVKAHKGDQQIEISAKAVVLATGGFARNKEMLERLVPIYAKYADVSVATMGATGDGIKMAVRAGADEYKDAWVIGLYAGSPVKALNATFSWNGKYKQSLFVNEKGERFVNEDLPYVSDNIAAQGAAWAITDSKDPKRVAPLNAYNDPKIAVKGENWAELAKAMGVPPKNLEQTMNQYNKACETGVDPLLKKPKELLIPFTKPPFYAVRVIPQTGGTIGGVKVNEKFQVLRKDGSVIKGLYAGGEVQNRPYYNRVYTSGSGLGLAVTTGRLAGTYAAQEK